MPARRNGRNARTRRRKDNATPSLSAATEDSMSEHKRTAIEDVLSPEDFQQIVKIFALLAQWDDERRKSTGATAQSAR